MSYSTLEAEPEAKLQRVPMNLRVAPELLAELRELKKLSGLSITDLVEAGARKWLASPELNAELERRIEELKNRKKP